MIITFLIKLTIHRSISHEDISKHVNPTHSPTHPLTTTTTTPCVCVCVRVKWQCVLVCVMGVCVW